MNIKKFYKDNSCCPICGNKLSLFLIINYVDGVSNIFKSELLDNKIIFRIFKCNFNNISEFDFLYIKNDKFHFTSDDIKNKINREYEIEQLFFINICNIKGIVEIDEFNYWVGEDYHYYSTSNDYTTSYNKLSNIKPIDNTSLKILIEAETFSFAETKNEMAEIYSITYFYDINETTLWNYSIKEKLINTFDYDYDFSEYFSKTFNFILNKSTLLTKESIIKKVKNCMLLS